MHLRILYNDFSEYHEITVCDTTQFDREKGRFRILQFSEEAVQGVVDLNAPERILFEYPRAMIHLMNENRPSFENVFMIGHGIGTLARHFPDKRFTIAELDSKLVEISRRYFACETANVHIGDGRQVLEQELPGSYHFIIIDAFTAEGTPRHLTTLQCLRLTREKLDPEGMLLINLIAKHTHDNQVCAIYTTLREVYSATRAFALPVKGSSGLLNMILVGGAKPFQFKPDAMAGFQEVSLHAGDLLVDESP